jgi:5'-nucleotidase
VSARPLILASNDDGIEARGLLSLREALLDFADVVTVAPRFEQSGKSHSITLHEPLRYVDHGGGLHSIEGTPADCVYVALFREGMLPNRPDLVVSGINHGANLGSDVFYSGTVAAAREAALRGIPAIAFSQLAGGDMDRAATIAARMVKTFLEAEIDHGDTPLLSINFPPGRAKGVRVTRLGRRVYAEGVDVREDPRGREYFWIGGPGGVTHEECLGSDTEAVDEGYVSMTPLQLEATHHPHLDLARDWLERYEAAQKR